MKKFLAITTVAASLLTLFVGCGAEAEAKRELRPIEKAQARAVSIGEQYLDYEISASEAKALLEDIVVPEMEVGDGQLYLRIAIRYLANIIGRPETTYQDIEKEVKEIASMDFDEIEKNAKIIQKSKNAK